MHGKYRKANSLKEIESILKEAGPKDCLVWQNITGERNLYYVKAVIYDKEEKLLKFELKDFKSDFSLKAFIYVKLDYRGTMLKAYIHKIEKNCVYVKYPDESNVQTVELRRENRTEFLLNEEVLITLRMKSIDSKLQDQVLKFQLMDIAESGMSILVSKLNKNFLEKTTEAKLTHLGNLRLKKPIELEKRYVEEYRYKLHGKNKFAYRAGFKLKNGFVMDEFLEFLEEFTREVTS